MKKFNLIILILAVAFAAVGAVNAAMFIPSSDKAKENAKAPENSPVISETTGGEWELDRIDFIHYAKPNNVGKGNKKGNACYKLLGVKWKSLPINYVINPTNQDGLSEQFIASTTIMSAQTWDVETSSNLFNTPSIDYTAQYGIQDYENTIAFGNYPDNGVIGVTSIWYTRKGKQIVEFDILFNEFYTWGDAEINPALMDFANIASHEIGHGLGLADIYNTSCSTVTMYGYSSEGEIDKRTLEQADIAGIEQLYGI